MAILCLGPEIPEVLAEKSIVHCPVITIVPCDIGNDDIRIAFSSFNTFTHLIFTSKSAVSITLELMGKYRAKKETFEAIAVGTATAQRLENAGITVCAVAKRQTAEGVVDVLKTMDLDQHNMLWPHARLARPVIAEHLKNCGAPFSECTIYDTVVKIPETPPSLDPIDEIFFSSPSTIDGFFATYGRIPGGIKVSCIGHVTEQYLSQRKDQQHATLL